MLTIKDLDKKIDDLKECDKCIDKSVKKFSPLKDSIDLNKVDDNYMRCECGKRPLDIVMSHILKIMIEEKIVPENATLRKNTPIPLFSLYYSSFNTQFISKDMLILIHPDFTQKVANRLINEVSEVKGVIKGDSSTTIGQFDKNSPITHFQLLAGSDDEINVIRTLINEKIITVKNQHKSHIEVAMTSENKLIKLHNFIENNNIKKDLAVDCMCGNGILGIYLKKYGFKKVIFNDINPEAVENLKINLKVNNITDGYEIYNENCEDLAIENADLCVIDAFPQSDIEDIIKKMEKIADYVITI